MKSTKFAVFALLIALVVGVLAGSASAADYKTKISLTIPSNASWLVDEAYILTVPEEVTVTTAGWNRLGAITVTRSADMKTSFDASLKLVVTAASTNGGLVLSGDSTQKIGYTIKAASGDKAETKEFTFTAAQVNKGASQDIGIDLESFTGKKAGTYEDYITYEVSIKSADVTTSATLSDALKDGAVVVIAYNESESGSGSCTFTNKDGSFSTSDNSLPYIQGAKMEINGNNLVATFAYGVDYDTYGPDWSDESNLYTITFDTDNNIYSQVVGSSLGAISLTSISVNGTEVTNLTKKGS